MNITNGSDFILLLNIEDIKGKPLRVADCAAFSVRLFTDDPRYALTFSKRDILTDGPRDRIAIESDQLERLESGVLAYDYSYSIYNPDFTGTETYDKVKTVYTDFYWSNRGNLENSENVVTWQIIKNLQDAIDACQVECGREMGALKKYVEEEYTNKLAEEINRVEQKIQDEVQRSNSVDIEFFKRIKELEDVLKGSGENVDGVLNVIEELKAADAEMRAKIKENAIGIEDANHRIDSLKATGETVTKELDRRLDAAERSLNVINDSDSNTPGSIANAIKAANMYADGLLRDARNGLATEDDLARVEGKIPVVPSVVSAFVNDAGYISSREIFDNFYKKDEADERHKALGDSIKDIEEWAVRKDESTVVKDPDGNIIRELVIDPNEPEYYTKEETDELLAALDASFNDGLDKAGERIDALGQKHDAEKSALDASIAELAGIHAADKLALDSSIAALEAKLDADITNLAQNYYTQDEVDGLFEDAAETFEETTARIDSSIAALEQKVDGDILNLATNYYDSEEIDRKFSAVDASLAGLEDKFDSSLSALEAKVDQDMANLDANYYTKTEIDGFVDGLDSSIAELASIHAEDKAALDASLRELGEKVDGDIENLASNYYDSEEIDRKFSAVEQTISDNKAAADASFVSLKAELDADIENLEQNYYTSAVTDSKFEETNSKIEENKAAVDASLASLEAKVDADIENLASNYYTRDWCDRQFEAVSNDINRAKAELEGKISDLDSSVSGRLDGVDASIAELDGKTDDISSRLHSAKTEFDGRLKVLEAIDHDSFATKVELSELDSSLSAGLETLGQRHDSELSALRSDVSTADDALSVRITALEQIDHSVYATKEELSAGLATLDSSVSSAISGLESRTKETTDGLSVRITALEQIDHSVYATKEELSALDSSVGAAIDGLRNDASAADSELSGRISTLEQIDHNSYASKDDLDGLKEELDALDSSVSARLEDLEEIDFGDYATKDDLERAKSTLDSSLAAVEGSLQKKVEDLSKTVDEKVANIDLSDYYMKSETYSAAEIDEKIANVDVSAQLASYATKEELEAYARKDEVGESLKVRRLTWDEYLGLGERDQKTLYLIEKND